MWAGEGQRMPSWEDGSASCGAGLLPMLPSKGRWCGCGAGGESGPRTVWIAGDKDRGLWITEARLRNARAKRKKKKKRNARAAPPPPRGRSLCPHTTIMF